MFQVYKGHLQIISYMHQCVNTLHPDSLQTHTQVISHMYNCLADLSCLCVVIYLNYSEPLTCYTCIYTLPHEMYLYKHHTHCHYFMA